MGVAAVFDFSRDPTENNAVGDSQMQQGARFTALITWADSFSGGVAVGPFTLFGYTARMQLRTTKTAPDPPVLSITSAAGRIKKGDGTTFGAAGHTDGTILLDVPDEDTALVPAVEGDTTYKYDLEIEDAAGNVERILEGSITVTPNVTR